MMGNDTRLKKEKDLDKLNMLGLYAEKKKPFRSDDDYGTSLSKGAMFKAEETAKEYRKDSRNRGSVLSPKTRGEVDEEAMKAGRQEAKETAAEERREARGMKKGGKVGSASKRADGIAQRGKTRGKMY